MASRRNRSRPIVAVGEVLMWLLFAVLLVPAGVVGWAIGHYTGSHGTRTVTVSASSAPATTTAAGTSTVSATTTAAAAPGTNTAAAKALFVSSGCGACHTFTPAGTSATVGPNLDTTPTESAKADGNLAIAAFVKQSIVDPNAYIAKGFPKGVMPNTFGSTLSKSDLATLVAFIVAGQK